MYADRLERMAKLLRADAINPTGVMFDLSTWGSPSAHAAQIEGDALPLSCGTTACAFGLAAISGEFKEEGLTYRISSARYNIVPEIANPQYPDHPDHIEEGFEAASVLFGISDDDVHYLFDPESYDETPATATGEIIVAERIERFIIGDIDTEWHRSYE